MKGIFLKKADYNSGIYLSDIACVSVLRIGSKETVPSCEIFSKFFASLSGPLFHGLAQIYPDLTSVYCERSFRVYFLG